MKEAERGAHQFEGKLTAVNDGKLHLEIAPDQSVEIALEQVQRAKLRFDW